MATIFDITTYHDFVVIQTCWARQISRWLLNGRIFEFHFWIVETNLTKIATAENPRNDSFSISPWNSFAFTIQKRFEMFGCFQASLVLKGKSRRSNAIVFYKCHIPYRYIQIEFAAIVLGRGSEVVTSETTEYF